METRESAVVQPEFVFVESTLILGGGGGGIHDTESADISGSPSRSDRTSQNIMLINNNNHPKESIQQIDEEYMGNMSVKSPNLLDQVVNSVNAYDEDYKSSRLPSRIGSARSMKSSSNLRQPTTPLLENLPNSSKTSPKRGSLAEISDPSMPQSQKSMSPRVDEELTLNVLNPAGNHQLIESQKFIDDRINQQQTQLDDFTANMTSNQSSFLSRKSFNLVDDDEIVNPNETTDEEVLSSRRSMKTPLLDKNETQVINEEEKVVSERKSQTETADVIEHSEDNEIEKRYR